MDRIKSFEANHDLIVPGIYLSRTDRNTKTFDIRLIKPNSGALAGAAMHTTEHLVATYVRNCSIKESVVYFGPMGCKTGYYLVVFDDISNEDVIKSIYAAFRFVLSFEGEIPGSSKAECGNYKYHDLALARDYAEEYLKYIEAYTPAQLEYPKA